MIDSEKIGVDHRHGSGGEVDHSLIEGLQRRSTAFVVIGTAKERMRTVDWNVQGA
jgi:hypothetical protein